MLMRQHVNLLKLFNIIVKYQALNNFQIVIKHLLLWH